MRILIVEDERRLSDIIKKGLIEEGFAVDQAFDGEEGQYLIESESYDVIVMDILLPKIDGIKICQNIRQKQNTVPILILTAKTQVEDRVIGLQAGADDYLAKPFAFIELKARLQALLRRSHHQISMVLKINDLEVDPIKHLAQRSGVVIALTPKEFSILEFLMRHQNEVITRTQITEHVWDYNYDALSNVVDVFIATLRKKVDSRHKIPLIHTIRGVGYTIKDSVHG